VFGTLGSLEMSLISFLLLYKLLATMVWLACLQLQYWLIFLD